MKFAMALLNALILTFNCGREAVDPEVLARHLSLSLPNVTDPEFIVISLQEFTPIAYAFLGGPFTQLYYDKFDEAVKLLALSWGQKPYLPLIRKNVGMTALIIFSRQDVTGKVSWLEDAGTGVGLWDMGNKGAVGVRLGYATDEGTVELTFVAAHLAPMEDGLERRNQDWKNVVKTLVFCPANKRGSRDAPSDGSSEGVRLLSDYDEGEDTRAPSSIYHPTSHVFLAGDLNYRTSRTKPTPQDRSSFPKPVARDQPSHFSTLLKSDQLAAEIAAGRTLHGFVEAPIAFPPTYKYSRAQRAVSCAEEKQLLGAKLPEEGDAAAFGWAPHRWPSWCDRILYLGFPSAGMSSLPSPRDAEWCRVRAYAALPLMASSDHRAVVAVVSVPRTPVPGDTVRGTEHWRVRPPYEVDPAWWERRRAARRLEVVVGVLAYLLLTWEGNAIALGTVIGAVGGWTAIRSSVL